MGISRDRRHKHRRTGGRMPVHQKKRKFELGRPPAMTKLGPKRVRPVRCRGGNMKYRALRLDTGNYSWSSQKIAKKTRLLGVVYNASNNELVRTNTLVKNSIVAIDATPFKAWFRSFYGLDLGKKKAGQEEEGSRKVSKHTLCLQNKHRQQGVPKLDPLLEEQFNTGRLLACISSRPGQSGRADGYILEGEELMFYKRKMDKKKHK
ncbi:ribosomal protein RPS8 [Toxoplasma gondii ME49]|uniref:40S ribosomal protein S8 n=2 Tax=Toxoplasma gondii TaxID=5811 RepID=B6KGK3_TOXGV|nr:ribosomal protein RPS8 [Toxoplasma gondii ME49]EPT24788.1 ribosomal protein RPS8 [Toxoplasma gondii ME49]ESS34051.1 ribosomal protein RPS8 [Toxoplasma gondii VEG]5XXU_I Chain I, Ribosomal protein eS8 [Toxoplasma gondii]CEL78263.1 TPA: 40S ribosomal protein S8, putative [Toxoplasma gondii VEG]|eukprot:XP_002366976.1 ribosomal protein RPS8 [Toxoplasma gondii ME49]